MSEPELIRIPRPEPPVRIPRPPNGHGASFPSDDYISYTTAEEIIRIPRPHEPETESIPMVKDRRGLAAGLGIPLSLILAVALYFFLPRLLTLPALAMVIISALPVIITAIWLCAYCSGVAKRLKQTGRIAAPPVDETIPYTEYEFESGGSITDLGTSYSICPICNSEDEDRKIWPWNIKTRCPICGAEHHPECWASLGRCGSLHRH